MGIPSSLVSNPVDHDECCMVSELRVVMYHNS